MGIFDFFKRNKKPKPATGKPSPEQVVFSDTVLDIIGPSVEKFGFLRHRVEVEEYFTRIIFRNGKLYIRISGTTFPTDYPYHYNIILGEGDSEDFYESDWNSIALWQLKNKIDSDADSIEFEFPYDDNVKISVSNANKELLQ